MERFLGFDRFGAGNMQVQGVAAGAGQKAMQECLVMENVDSSENSSPAAQQRVLDWQEIRADERRLEARRAQLLAQGQKLFARIRPSSKYYGQTDKGDLFAVVVDDFPGYPVRGGPGGKYRLADVDLFASFKQDLPPVQITFEAKA